MPKYTLTHGGLKIGTTFHPHGAEIELSEADAATINKRGQHLRLSAVVAVELEHEKAKAEAVAKAEKAAKGGAK